MKIGQYIIGLLAFLTLCACDAGPSAVLPDQAGLSPTEQTQSKPDRQDGPLNSASEPEPVEIRAETKSRADEGAGVTITQTRYGQWPLWSSNRNYTAYENATYHYEKHGSDFGAESYGHWLSLVHGFIHNPPEGTQTLNRNNGDVLFYNAEQNVFAVMTRAGAPRTMFRPDDGPRYWQKQKQIEAERRTIRN